jgi:SAM-dependent methyltransferase
MAGSAWSASGTTPGQDPNVGYALGSSPGESARLQRQADELSADSAALLDRVGPRPGQSVIDLGCGPRGILDLLAERVSPAGRVVGLDADPAHTALAAEFAARQGLEGVEIMTADAGRTWLASGSFDQVRSMRPQALEMGLATVAELDELDAAARPHLEDPHTVVISGLLFLTWARKPGHAR